MVVLLNLIKHMEGVALDGSLVKHMECVVLDGSLVKCC